MENSLRAELARAKIEADALAADNARLERLAAERQVPTGPAQANRACPEGVGLHASFPHWLAPCHRYLR